MENKYETGWQKKKTEVFWGEISPCDDLIQVYEDDETFLDSLTSFVSAGIHAAESTIVIATSSHLRGLETRLLLNGINPDAARESDLYIPLEANETLARFIVYGLPNEASFRQLITGLIKRSNGRRIRAFGEMVALLWGQGFKSATLKLQEFWNSLSQEEAFFLFCQFPEYGATQDTCTSIDDICRKHSEVIANWKKTEQEAPYKNTPHPNSSIA